MQCLPLNIDILGEVQTAKIEIVILLINKKKKHKPETGENPIPYLNERKKNIQTDLTLLNYATLNPLSDSS